MILWLEKLMFLWGVCVFIILNNIFDKINENIIRFFFFLLKNSQIKSLLTKKLQLQMSSKHLTTIIL